MPEEAYDPQFPPSSADAEATAPQEPTYPTLEELAGLLPQYEIHRVLGIGGMGAVYLGRQGALDRWVAIKLLPLSAAYNAEDAAGFIKEARAMAKLVHPNIVAVFDFGQTMAGHLYLVMEFVEGNDLHRRTRNGEITHERAVEVVKQLCDALQFAHDHGVAHRDIKPANILISGNWQVKVADFGLARDLAAVPNADEPEYGTPDYTAPERLIVGAVVDHRADLYALGVVIHEMLTGKTPANADAATTQKLPPVFASVISKCLMHDPERRYQRASQVKQALISAIAEEKRKVNESTYPPGHFPPTDPISRQSSSVSGRPRARKMLATVGWSFACLALAGAFGYIILKDRIVIERPSAETEKVAQADPAEKPPMAEEETEPTPGPPVVIAPPTAPTAPQGEPTMPATPEVAMAPQPQPAPAAPAIELVAMPAPQPTPAPAADASQRYTPPPGEPGQVLRLQGHTGVTLAVRILPDQRRVLSISNDASLRIWDLATGKEIRSIQPGISGLNRVAVTQDGQRAVVISSASDKAALLNLETGEVMATTSVPNDRLITAAFTPADDKVLLGCAQAADSLFLWDPAAQQPPQLIKDWSGVVYDITPYPDAAKDKLFVTGGEYNEEARNVTRPKAAFVSVSKAEATPYPAQWDAYTPRMNFNVARTIVTSASTSGLRIYTWPGLQRIQQFPNPTIQLSRVSGLRPVGHDRLLLALCQRSLRVLDASTGEERWTIESLHTMSDFAVSEDESWAVTSTTRYAKDTPQDGDFDLIVWRLPDFSNLSFGGPDLATQAREQLGNLAAVDAELAGIHTELLRTAKKPSAQEHEASLVDLRDKYVAALRREATRSSPSEQKQLMDEANLVATWVAPPLASADATVPEKLRRFRSIYRTQFTQIKGQYETALAAANLLVQQKLMPLKNQREFGGDKLAAERVAALLVEWRKGNEETLASAGSSPAGGAMTSAPSQTPAGSSVEASASGTTLKRPDRPCEVIFSQRVVKGYTGGEVFRGKPPADLGAVVGIAGSANHGFVILPDGSLRSWGVWGADNKTVTVPETATDVVKISTTDRLAMALSANGRVTAWDENGDTKVIPPEKGRMVADICAGYFSEGYILYDDGTLKPGGVRAYRSERPPLPAVRKLRYFQYTGYFAILTDGKVVSWGTSKNQGGMIPEDLVDVVDICASRDFSVALKRDGDFVGWGQTAYDQRFRRRRYTGEHFMVADGQERLFSLHRPDHSWEFIPNPSKSEYYSEDRIGMNEGKLRGCVDLVLLDNYFVGIKPK